MKRVTMLCLGLTLVLAQAAMAAKPMAEKKMVSPEVTETLNDVKKTLGVVPSFFNQVPDAAKRGAWEALKGIELGETSIPGKYKSLIGLAVASQVPCRYCTHFDTEAARVQGATEAEIAEAVTMASIVRHWSTVLNGNLIDEAKFRTEVMRLTAPKAADTTTAARNEASEPAETTTNPAARATYEEIRKAVGFVPEFMRMYPEEGIAGAWREFAAVQANPKSAIPMKYKELLGIAVAAQIPCRYCSIYHSEAVKVHGGTDREVREAVAIAALTRRWSTFFQGMQLDERVFNRDVAAIVKHMKKHGMKTAAAEPDRSEASEQN